MPINIPSINVDEIEESTANESDNQAQWAPGSTSYQVTYRVPWAAENDFAISALGYHYVDETYPDNPILKRIPPMRHPTRPNLYANRIITSKPIKFVGKSQYQTEPDPLNTSQIIQESQYKYSLVTVSFETLPYRVRPKNGSQNVTRQYDWYTYTTFEPGEETIEVPFGSLKFAEGPPSTGEVKQSFQGTVGLTLPKTLLKMTWYKVPEAWVRDVANDGPPTNILKHVGKVNASDFLGYPAGTLLLQPPTIVTYSSEVSYSGAAPENYYDVTFNMLYFNPQTGVESPITRGHNTVPWFQDRLFYYATVDGEPDGRPLYPNAEFDDLFRHWSK